MFGVSGREAPHSSWTPVSEVLFEEAVLSTYPKAHSKSHDPELINREVLEVCDYYLRERRKEGRRYTYRCPGCGGRRFEVEPIRGIAGCFSPECGLPTTTDALGIIGYMENLDTRGAQFRECLEKGYEILGMEPESKATTDSAENNTKTTDNGSTIKNSENGANHPKSSTKSSTKRRSWIAGEAKAGGLDEENQENAGIPGPATDTADDPPRDGTNETYEYAVSERSGGRLIEAYTELPDGTREPLEAFVMDEAIPSNEEQPDEERSSRSSGSSGFSATRSGPPAKMENGHALNGTAAAPRADETGQEDRNAQKGPGSSQQREINHRVYQTLLRLCPLEGREKEFFEGRGLDQATIEEGRFGSISKRRSHYVTDRLERRFADEELLTVPGFYRAESGQLRFTLYGDYALIPYYDREGYILTIEGRLTGEPTREDDPKYKALSGSGVHLYVHPKFDPGEVVAFCEGAIGAMVAARAGIPVAAIKGMRNYRCPPQDRYSDYSVLPELKGVDFGGLEIAYLPDLDVKPKTREEAFGIVPEACEWLIERQGGKAKVAMLPEDSKDLDEWLLSLDEDERVRRFLELVNEAPSVERWDSECKTPAGSSSEPQSTIPSSVEGERNGPSQTPQPSRTSRTSEYYEPGEQKRNHAGSADKTTEHVQEAEGEKPDEDDTTELEQILEQSSRSTGKPSGPASAGATISKTFQRQTRQSNRQSRDQPTPPEQKTTGQAETGATSSTEVTPEAGDEQKLTEPKETTETTVTKEDSSSETRIEKIENTSSEEGDQGNQGETERQSQGRTEDLDLGPKRSAGTAGDQPGRLYTGMERWHSTRDMSDEQVERIRAATEYHAQIERHSPEYRGGRVRVPKWNAGEVFIALTVAVGVAVAVCVLAYLARTQAGLIGDVGTLVTSPVWWIELLLYWIVGSLVAEGVVRVRHQDRRRQVREHIRGRVNRRSQKRY